MIVGKPRTYVVLAALLVSLAAVGAPASADPASTGRACAYGVSVGGTLTGGVVEREPEVCVVYPPGSSSQSDFVLDHDESPLFTARVLHAEAEFAAGDKIVPRLSDVAGVNARAYAVVEDVCLLPTPAGGCGTDLVTVAAETVAFCAGGQAFYDAQSRIIAANGDEVDLSVVIDALRDAAGDHVQVEANDRGATADGSGVFVNALHVTVPGPDGGEPVVDIVVAHAEVSVTCA